MIVLEDLAEKVLLAVEEEKAAGRASSIESRGFAEGEQSFLLEDAQWELKALQRFSQTGNLAQVAREMGRTIYELNKLSRTEWWLEELQALRREEMAISNVRLTNILDKALGELEDRLENGETVLDKMGGEHQIPLDSKTLIRIVDVVFDKRQIIRGQPTEIVGADGKLASLAEKLSQLGSLRQMASRAEEARIVEQPMEARRSVGETIPRLSSLEDRPILAESLEGTNG